MSIFNGILSTANTALRTNRQALNVVSHNIANAGVEGYSRQLPVISTNEPLTTAQGIFGTGVRVDDVVQVRDRLLDSTFHRESSTAGRERTRHQILMGLEDVVGSLGDSGIGPAVDRFFSAWSELASRPESPGVRSVVRSEGRSLVTAFQTVNRNLDDLRFTTEQQLQASVDRVNAIARELADVNGRVISDETGGHESPDLRDMRGRLIDELSTHLEVQVVHRDNGGVGVYVGGLALVDGAHHLGVEIRTVGGELGVGMQGRTTILAGLGGSVEGALQALNEHLPDAVDRMNGLAGAIIEEVNTAHAGGLAPDGSTGVDFFTGSAAGDIAVAPEIEASIQAIAAGTDDGSGVYRAGASDVALAIARLRDDPSLGSLGVGFRDFLEQTISESGFETERAGATAEIHEALAQQADNRRESLSGVSTEEEMLKLIQFQTGYEAAARVIRTADEMLETLLTL